MSSDVSTGKVVAILVNTAMETGTHIQPAPVTWTKYKNLVVPLNSHMVYCEISWELM